jgi:antitoxin (DNA-binding transcriptional repressor) of toxin-antitoxin stability system
MASHSIAEAKNHLSELIDRALDGEAIVITRHGRPVIEFKPVGQQGRPMTAADIDRLRAGRVQLLKPDNDPKSIVERMRDEDVERLLRR